MVFSLLRLEVGFKENLGKLILFEVDCFLLGWLAIRFYFIVVVNIIRILYLYAFFVG